MRALRFHGKEDIRVEDIPTPELAAGHVRIRPAFVGICGTDVHEYGRGATLIPQSSHVRTGRSAPLTLGHEISGVVDEVGAGVTEVRAGDHVAIQPILSDDSCYACLQGSPNLCAVQGFYGLSTDGGLADYLVVEARNARKVPANVSLEVAALIEPLSVGWHAVRRNINPQTSSALVMGAGPIGLCVIQALKAHSVSTIIVADTNSARAATAKQAGATHFLNPASENVAEACAKYAPDSKGVQVAFDTAGKQVTLDTSIAALAIGGTVVNIAIWGGEAKFMPNAFVMTEKRYTGSAIYTRDDFDEVIRAVGAGTIDPGFMITSKIALADTVSHGILKLLHDPGSDIKILVDLSKSSTIDSGA